MKYTDGKEILTKQDLRKKFPNISFANGDVSEKILTKLSLDVLEEAPAMELKADERLVKSTVKKVKGKFIESWEVKTIELDYATRRALEYPSIESQLETLWKIVDELQTAGTEISIAGKNMLKEIKNIKQKHPKISIKK